MKTVRIEVTADDIARGRPGSPCRCPVAIATRRVLGRGVQVSTFNVAHARYAHLIPLPLVAIRWIQRYDLLGRRAMEPIAFDWELPDDCPVKEAA